MLLSHAPKHFQSVLFFAGVGLGGLGLRGSCAECNKGVSAPKEMLTGHHKTQTLTTGLTLIL